MKTLYFDIDGTILLLDTPGPKPALADGALERVVREAGFERLVCVGQIVASIRAGQQLGNGPDGEGIVFTICEGAFTDEDWFRDVVELVEDPDFRAEAIEMDGDWWYADDLADYYLASADMLAVFAENPGGRIHKADPDGDGSNLLAWLARSAG